MEAATASSIFSPFSTAAFSNTPKSITHSSLPWSYNVSHFRRKTSLLVSVRPSFVPAASAGTGQIIDKSSTRNNYSSTPGSVSRDSSGPKVDKSGRFCSPRAARELALSIIYAACLEGNDPVRLFEKRVNARRETDNDFDKASLTEYNHMSFGGPPVVTQSIEEANNLLHIDEKVTEIEAAVLSAPPKLVYSKLILRFTRKLLVAVGEKWDSNVLAIEKVVPANWKNRPAGKILELSLLHLAMSEIDVLGTRHQIVINEAVDLAKRFCDGAAPRIVNGCLRTFVKDLEEQRLAKVDNNLSAAPAAAADE